jgi:hypothetical protein
MKTILVNGQKVNAADFAANVLGSCFETWDWWVEVKYYKPFAWDSPPEDSAIPFVRVTHDNPELSTEPRGAGNFALQLPTLTSYLSIDTLVKAYEQVVHSQPGFDWQNLDAASSDAILQQAVYGKQVYC